jgi:hypothetical protein
MILGPIFQRYVGSALVSIRYEESRGGVANTMGLHFSYDVVHMISVYLKQIEHPVC